MRKLLVILALAIAAGLVGYGVARLRFETYRSGSVDSGADIAWMKSEFNLSEKEFAAIRDLHLAYGQVCARHCSEIIEAQSRLEQLRSDRADHARLAEAEQELARLEAVCNEATRAHIYQVAAKMPLQEGVRFIRATEPHLASMPHDGARGLTR